ncbi:MAG: carboxypeptidase-like regulatory domain-containing protein [Bryobacteraceae bacterium]
MSRAAVVFIGTVAFTDHDPSMGFRQRTFVKFDVEEGFKGVSSGVREIWIDPGSFTSCYADYNFGQRLLVFGYGGRAMSADASTMSVVPGQAKQKPLPQEIVQKTPPVVYYAPECSGTHLLEVRDPGAVSDVEYLRQYKAGTATPSVRGRATEDLGFGIFDRDPVPGLPGVKITLTGNGADRSTVTDASGYYVFANTPAGAYRVTPSLRTYSSPWKVRDVGVPPGGCGAADFDMIGSGSIEGSLLDAVARPAATVRVDVLRLNHDGKPVYYAVKRAKTDGSGRFQVAQLPSGDFRLGVNLFDPPDPETPYMPTQWSDDGSLSIHLSPGEHKRVSPLRLPPRLAVRKVEAEVRWPDGQAAKGVDVWGEVGGQAAAHGETNAEGIARIEVLEGARYSIEAKTWVGPAGQREVARSGAAELVPGQLPIHLKLVLTGRTKDYQ